MRWKQTKAMGIALVAALALGLAGCGSSSDDTAEVPPPPPVVEPDPVAVEMKGIDDAIAAAQTAVAAVNDASTDEMVMAADAAVAAAMKAIADATRITAADVSAANARLATITGPLAAAKTSREMSMDLASQRDAIEDRIAEAMTAVDAVMDDSDAATVTAADAAIAAAKAAIAAAGDISNAEAAAADNRVAALMTSLDEAKTSRMAAMDAENDRAMQIAEIRDAAGNVDTSDLTDQAKIDAAEAAIAALKATLVAATDVSDADKAMYQGRVTAAEMAVATAERDLRHAAQTMALSGAVEALQAIDLGDLSDEAKIDAAADAIAALETALAAATELSPAEKTEATTLVATANRTVMTAQGRMDVAGQKMALSGAHDALGTIDLDNLMTQAQIDAANRAISALDLALEGATDLTDADKLDAIADVTLAKRKVTAAETMLTENVGNQRMALTEAGTALGAIDLDDLDTAEKITAANAAVEALKAALAAATHLSDADKAMYQSQLEMADETVKTAQTGMDRDGRMMAQRTAITDAVMAATTAVGAVDDTATEEQVMEADNAIAALQKAIDDAVDLGEGDTDVASAQGALDSLKPVLASAKTSRTAAMEAEEEERLMAEAEAERKANEGRAATAAKLYAAISPASGDGSTEADTARFAEITPVAADDPTPFISVNYGGELVTAGQANSATLNLDKDTPVADHRGWKGNRYVDKDDDGKVITEARVYSDEVPMMGKKFGSADAVTETGAFRYQLTAGMYTVAGTAVANAPLVGGSSFDQSAGVKEFALPDPNPTDAGIVVVPGTFHGVSGTYSCTPTTGNTCAANKAARGFVLGLTADDGNAFTASADAWTFKPTDPDARVTESADTLYAVYGWWLRTPATGAWTASAFADYYGTPVEITGLDALNGSATYTGGAAGKYALSSTTGGDNDAGHFTARATLDADFDTEMISGTVDQFMSDGEAKDWSVALNKSGFNDAGQILGAAGADDSTPMKTVWTRDGTAAAASGHWKGDFREVGSTGVPKVVTGDFYTEFGNSGKMVGAFGAKTE